MVIGPHDRGSRDVRQLATAGALQQLRQPANPGELAAIWIGVAGPARDGADARDGPDGRLLEAARGAARRSAELLQDLLTARSPVRG